MADNQNQGGVGGGMPTGDQPMTPTTPPAQEPVSTPTGEPMPETPTETPAPMGGETTPSEEQGGNTGGMGGTV